MAAIILPHRWTRRPSGKAEINWSNPLSNGIVVALIPGANEAVCGGPVVIANGGALAPRPHGLGFTGSAWLSDDVAYAPNGYVDVGTGNLTDFVVTELTGDAVNFSYACGSYSGATDGVLITLRHSAIGERWGVYNGGSFHDSNESFVIGAGAHTFTYTRDGSTQYLYRNGVLRNSVVAVNGATSTAQFCLGNIVTSGGAFSVGPTANIALALRFKRFLGASEIAELSRAPWQIFRPLRRRLYFAPAAGGGDQTITANLYEDADTLSASASAAITAAASIAEASDASSATASVAVIAGAVLLEVGDSLSSAAGTAAFATAELLEAADYSSAAASVLVSASAALFEQVDQIDARGSVSLTVTAAILERDDTLSADGGSASFATATLLEAADTLLSGGAVAVTGTAVLAEAADALSSAVTVSLTAVAALQESADLLTSSGSVGTVVSTADASLQEQPDVVSGTAVSSITGAAAIVEAGDITVSDGAVLVQAYLAAHEQGDTVSATSAFDVFADAALYEQNDRLTAAVVQKIARRIAASDTLGPGIAASDRTARNITSSDGLI